MSILEKSLAVSQQPDPMTDPLIGHILKDSYRIESLIADGGMSRVYLAEQVSLGRRIAVKMLLPANETGGAPGSAMYIAAPASQRADPNTRCAHPNSSSISRRWPPQGQSPRARCSSSTASSHDGSVRAWNQRSMFRSHAAPSRRSC